MVQIRYLCTITCYTVILCIKIIKIAEFDFDISIFFAQIIFVQKFSNFILLLFLLYLFFWRMALNPRLH